MNHFDDWQDVSIESLMMEDDRSLLEHINEAIQRQAQLVLEPGRSDKSSITMTVKLEALDEENVDISATTKAADPASLERGCIARVTPDGQVLSRPHRQQVLPIGARLTTPKGAN